MIIKPKKLTPKKLSGLMITAVALLAIMILTLLSLFLYKNFYQTITQTKEIMILREKVAVETINLDKFDAIMNKLKKKTGPLELKIIKNPFR